MKNTKQSISEYTESAQLHGDATLRGDSKVANKAYDNMMVNINHIYSHNPSFDGFLSLLEHENESVRLWSATHGLLIDEDRCLTAIKKLADGNGILSFSASMVIDQWQQGQLESPSNRNAK